MRRLLLSMFGIAAATGAILSLAACSATHPKVSVSRPAPARPKAAPAHAATGPVTVASARRGRRHHAKHRARPQRAPHHKPGSAAAPAPTSSAPVNHCRDNRYAQQAIVSIAAQHMWMCAHHRTVYGTPVTTGMTGPYTETPTGNYWIQGRDRNTSLEVNLGDGRYRDYQVKFWIPFNAPLFGFHDASWQTFPYGSAKYTTDGSHGCVHMPLTAIRWFYRWVASPTAVRIVGGIPAHAVA